MTSGRTIFLCVCEAADVKAEIAQLAAADLAALHDHMEKLPHKDGIPGVIAAQVKLEAAARWFLLYKGGVL